MDILLHYPPELLKLLAQAIPCLCPGKQDVLALFKGAGVPVELMADFAKKVATDPMRVNKYEIARGILGRLNEKGEATLRERRAILQRVVEINDFSDCSLIDQPKAKALVAEIRRVAGMNDLSAV